MIRERLIGQMRNEGAFCLYAETLDAPAGESHDVELPNMLQARELLSGPLLEMGCSAHFDFEANSGSGGDRLYYSRALTDNSSSLTTTVNTTHHRMKHHPCSVGSTVTLASNQFWPNGPLYQGGWHEAGMATGGHFQITAGADGIFTDDSGSSSSVFGSTNGGLYPITMNAWVKVDDLTSLSGGNNGVHPVAAVSKVAPYGTVSLTDWKAIGIGFEDHKNTVPCIFEMSASAASTGVAGDVLFTASKILGADEFRGGSLNTSTAPTGDHNRWHMITGVFLSPTNVRLYWNGIRVADYESGEGKDASGSNESFSFPTTVTAELSSTPFDGPFNIGHIGGFPVLSTRVSCDTNRTSPLPEAPCLPGKIGNVSFFPSGLSSTQVAELYSTTSQAMTIEMDQTTAGTAGFLARQANKFDDALPQVLIEAHTGKAGSNGDLRSWSTGMWHAHMDLDTQTGRLTALNGDQSNSSVTTGFGFAAMVGGFGTPFNSQKSVNFGSGNKIVGFSIDTATTGPRVKLRDPSSGFNGALRSIVPAPEDRITPTSDALGKKDLVSGFFAMNGSGAGTDGVDFATATTAVEFTHHLKDNFPITFFLNSTNQKAFLPLVFFNEFKSVTEQLTIIRALKGNNPMRTRVPLTASPRPFRLNGSQTGRKIP